MNTIFHGTKKPLIAASKVLKLKEAARKVE